MKQLTGALLTGLLLFVAPPAFAWDLPGVPKGDDPAITAVKKQNGVLLQKTHAATVAILDSLALMQKAAGDTAEAQRITEVAAKLKKANPEDPASLSAANAEVKAIASKLETTEFPPRALNEEERHWAKEAMTGLGVAMLADAQVAREALGLAGEVGRVAEQLVRKNPLALGQVKDATSAVDFVAAYAGEQAAALKVIHDAALRFGQAHRLEPPTPAQVQKAFNSVRAFHRQQQKK